MNDDTPLKRCSKCSVEKPATLKYFHKSKNRKDGLYPSCKDCVRTSTKARASARFNEILAQGHKVCGSCGKDLPISEFAKSSNRVDGHYCHCKRCSSIKAGRNPDFQWEDPFNGVPNGYKRCLRCRKSLPLASFSKRKNARVIHRGYRGWCKACVSESSLDYYYRNQDAVRQYHRQWTIDNAEHVNAYNRLWRENNPERVRGIKRREYRRNWERYRARAKGYYRQLSDKEREKIKRRNRDRYRRNPAPFLRSCRAWAKRNPHKQHIYYQRRQARKRALNDTFSPTDWAFALSHFGYICAICGRPRGLWHTLAMDHWIPLSSNDCPGTIPANIIPLCHGIDGCNNSKGAKDAEVWLIEKLGKRKAKAKLKEIEAYFELVRQNE